MKELPNAAAQQAATVLRSIAGASALFVAFTLTVLLFRAPTEIFFSYQIAGVLLSLTAFTLTFESHFYEYWHLEAVLFFCASLSIWGGIALALQNPLPLTALLIATPIITVLLPWHWHFQLGISLLCLLTAALSNRIIPVFNRQDLLWPGDAHLGAALPRALVVAAESAVAVLAAIQLERQRQRQQVYVEALAADEEQFRALIEDSPDGLTVVNAGGTIVFQSPSARRLLGGNADKSTGRNAFEFLDNDGAHRFREALDACLRSADHKENITVRCRHADGSWRTIEAVAKHLRNYGSEPLVVFNWRDVSERVAQELRIRESEERFRSIFQYSTNPISLSWRADGRYFDVNDEWLRILGYTRAEAIGKDPMMLGIWADPEDFVRFGTEFLHCGEIRNRKTEFRAKDGSIICGLLSAVMLEMQGKQFVLGVVSVISRTQQLPLLSDRAAR